MQMYCKRLYHARRKTSEKERKSRKIRFSSGRAFRSDQRSGGGGGSLLDAV